MALRAMEIDHNRLYTSEEFQNLPEADQSYELIDGKLVRKAVPKYDHNRVVLNLIKAYILFDPTEAIGEVIQETSFRLSGDTAPTPDLSFYSFARKPKPGTPMAATPDLAVEVQSPGQSMPMLEAKLARYIAGGVKLGWLVLLPKKVVQIYRPSQAQPQVLGLDDQLEGEEVIPGFSIPVAQIFGK